MPVPKSVTKISRNGQVTFTSDVPKAKYYLKELIRGALRDTGKFVCNRFRRDYYSSHKKRKGKVGRFTQYWVRRKETDLKVGLKPNVFYGGFQEFGSSKTRRLGLLTKAVENNLTQIIQIQSQYLGQMNSNNPSVDESEFKGGADGE